VPWANSYCGFGFIAASVLLSLASVLLGLFITAWLGQWGAAASRGDQSLSYYFGTYAGLTSLNIVILIGWVYFQLVIVAIRGAKASHSGMIKQIMRGASSPFSCL
jgi:hypothetical protein